MLLPMPHVATSTMIVAIQSARNSENEKAAKDFSVCITLQPEFGLHYLRRGLCYKRLEDYETALKDLGKAVELLPDDSECYSHRGYTHLQLQNYDRALADCQRAVELQPGDHPRTPKSEGEFRWLLRL